MKPKNSSYGPRILELILKTYLGAKEVLARYLMTLG